MKIKNVKRIKVYMNTSNNKVFQATGPMVLLRYNLYINIAFVCRISAMFMKKYSWSVQVSCRN